MQCTISLFILILNCVPIFSQEVDYCSKDLCKAKRKHIACGNDGKINSTCANYSEVIALTPETKANIVKKHNEYRNKIALGQISHFQSASCMATMQWHDELARMADLNVKSCTTTHDQCRNTFNFRFSGQNIARRTTRESTITLEQLNYNIHRGIDRWFNENENCTRDGTTVYNQGKKKCGHFTVMIAERNTHLGCAILHMKKTKTIFTCNYAWTNKINAELYSPGNATSKCKTGASSVYPGLCSTKETYV